MKASEITLAVFTDYSKAFDTIDFSVLIFAHTQLF